MTSSRFIRDGCEASQLHIIRPTWPCSRNAPLSRRQMEVVCCSQLMADLDHRWSNCFCSSTGGSLPFPDTLIPVGGICRLSVSQKLYLTVSSPFRLHQYLPTGWHFSVTALTYCPLCPTHTFAHRSTRWSRDLTSRTLLEFREASTLGRNVKQLSHRDTARAKRIRNGLEGIRETCDHRIFGHRVT